MLSSQSCQHVEEFFCWLVDNHPKVASVEVDRQQGNPPLLTTFPSLGTTSSYDFYITDIMSPVRTLNDSSIFDPDITWLVSGGSLVVHSLNPSDSQLTEFTDDIIGHNTSR